MRSRRDHERLPLLDWLALTAFTVLANLAAAVARWRTPAPPATPTTARPVPRLAPCPARTAGEPCRWPACCPIEKYRPAGGAR